MLMIENCLTFLNTNSVEMYDMAERTVNDDTIARIFVGLAIPMPIQKALRNATNHYSNYTDRVVPAERIHITLFFLGDVLNVEQYLSRFQKALPLAFAPVVSITHLGRGIPRKQLWAYVNPSPVFLNMRSALIDRLKRLHIPLPKRETEYVPHIHVATLYGMSRGIGLPDTSVVESFIPREISIFESIQKAGDTTHKVRGAIKLVQ